MKYMLLVLFVALGVACLGLDCAPFGPTATTLHCANFFTEPISMGTLYNGQEVLFLWEGGVWNNYVYYTQGLPITGTCMLSENTLMATFAGGSYSDGVYNIDLQTHQWVLNEWFFWPHFICHDPLGGAYYVGEREGLYHSTDASNWPRISALGSGECYNMAIYGTHLVTQIGSSVKYSLDSGLTWQTGTISNLSSFRYTDSGVLYAIMDVGSDSDGLWRSDDWGATWVAVYYTSNLSCVGPEYAGYVVLGWDQPNTFGGYVGLLSPQDILLPLQHDSLNSPVHELDVFPLINTPSFYVLNGLGCFYVTSFVPVANDDQVLPSVPEPKLVAYPNPARQQVSVSWAGKSESGTQLKGFNIKGQLVAGLDATAKGAQTCANWDLRAFNGVKAASGVYLLQLCNADGHGIASTCIMVVK